MESDGTKWKKNENEKSFQKNRIIGSTKEKDLWKNGRK